MIKRGMNKKAQFYLISAIVLATVIIGIVTISNYSEKEFNTELQNLKEEIQIESAYFMDYGLYNKLNEAELYGLTLDFTDDYISYTGEGKDLYFIFGNSNNITITGWQETEKEVSVSSGSSQAIITDEAGKFTGGINPDADKVILSIDDASYEFEVNEGENFYFVLSQKINKGENILTG